MVWAGSILSAFVGAIIAAIVIASTQSSTAPFDLDLLGKTAGIAIAPLTLGLVFLTWVLARETRQSWLRSISPHIVVTIEPHERRILFVELIIENVGMGPAFNISTSLDPEIVVATNRKVKRISDASILKAPILKPRQRISIHIGRWNELDPRKTFVRCECKDALGNIHKFGNAIDLTMYDSFVRLGTDPLDKMASELEKMRQAIDKIGEGWRKIEVNRHSAHDREIERMEREEEIQELTRGQQS